jgi:hypothetical protein
MSGYSAAQTLRYDARTWGETADTLRAPAVGARIALKSAFIVPGSVSVTVDGVALPVESYRVNLHLGTIRFSELPEDAVVVVRYQRKPLLMAPVYSLRPAEVSRPDAVEAVPERVATVRPPEEAPAPSLTFGGTKSVSFATGTNRGSTLDQSLEATIEGQLSPTLRVRAILSDNNLPVQPEGNTEELEYFDRIFIEMEGTGARATVGDLSLDNRISTFSPLTRQLRGIAGAAWSGRGRLTAAGAETKGQFRAVEFRGTTGLQGPYALLSPSRTTLEVIIAGTERVYIDGVRAERGQNRDYVVDYDAGSITFTPRRLITTDTEIAVDFEVTQEEYARSTALGAAEKVVVGGGVALHVVAARETDDDARPLSTTLSEDDRAVIAAAGDDPDLAITGGVTATAPGEGLYVLIPPDTLAGTPAHFRFDEINGDYQVVFVEVAANSGDYRRAGISARGTAYFEFVGANAGTYRVGRRLPLPQTSDLFAARVARESGAFTFDGEWNASRHDRNTLSGDDDDDNQGQAGQVRAALEGGEAWRVRLAGTAGVLEDRFHSFDRVRPGYYYRDWNLEDVALEGRETTGELSASVARASLGSARYAFGRLDRDAFDGVKHELAVSGGSLSDRGVSLRALHSRADGTDSDRTRRSLYADAAWGWWRVVPSVSFGAETYRNDLAAAADSGRAYDLVAARLSSRKSTRVAWRVEGERRETDGIDPSTDDWIDARRDDTVSGSLSYRPGGSAQGEVQLIHRREEDLATGEKRNTDLARLKAGAEWNPVALRADADYEVSQNDAVTLQRSVVFVGEGKGDYNELGEEVGKGKGSFAVVFLPTTDATPVHTVAFNLRLQWRPSRNPTRLTGVGGWILRNVSLDQVIGVREESTYEPAWKVYAMLPSALQRDDATVFGTSTIRQDWSLLDAYKNLSLTFRLLREDREDNRFEGIRESSFLDEHALRLSRSLSARLSGTIEGGRRGRARGGEGLPEGTGSQYDVEEYFALVGAGIVIWAGANLDVDVRGADLADEESGARQRSIKLQPRLVWRVADQVNVFGTYELAEVSDRGDASVRPLVFEREGTSQRWSLTPNLRISKFISVYATYAGRNERVFSGQRVTEHEFRLETRAYF